MARLFLPGGSYTARSVIANCQRCINLFPEANTKDAPTPTTHYQRPGLVPKAQGPALPVRGLYRASNGNGYCVIGANVYSISPTWALTLLGTVMPNRTNPVSFGDNGIEIMLVDGSPYGWVIDMVTNAYSQIVDPTGSFTGADKIQFISTFTLWNVPGTRRFGSTLSNQIQPFDPLQTASKVNYPDLLETLLVRWHEIVLLGSQTGEIWYLMGSPLFPFAQLPGSVIEHGTCARYSVTGTDIATFWLGQDTEGSGVVFRLRGYETKVVSNYALAYAIRKMKKSVGISDAIAYCYQLDGHVFYVLVFPAGNQTWVYDMSIDDPEVSWHQEAWTDSDGNLNRHRGNCAAFINGVNVVGDWENGTIYEMDLDAYTDTVGGEAGPISFVRTFPHIVAGTDQATMQEALANGKRIQYTDFKADLECGMAPLAADGSPAKVTLRWSVDRGRTFGNGVLQTAGAPGEYLTQPGWSPIGVGRDVVFELSHSIAGPAALNGAWVEGTILGS